MAVVEQNVVLTTKNSNGDTVIQYPLTTIDQVDGGIATINGNTPDANGNIDILTNSAVKTTFTADDSRWGTVTDGVYPLTLAISTGDVVICMKKTDTGYEKVEVGVIKTSDNIILTAHSKFEGYIITI